MIKINKEQLKELILNGITSEELNSKYDYSHIIDMCFMFYECPELRSIPDLDTSNVTDMRFMFDGCYNLRSINPRNFHLFDFTTLKNKYIMELYPELYI